MDPATMMLASSAMQGIGGLFSGILGMDAHNAQAKALGYAADQAQRESSMAANLKLREGASVEAGAATQMAANGGGFTGSNLGVLSSLAQDAMYNAHAAIYRGLSEAQNDRYQAGVERAQSRMAMVSGLISGGSSMMGGMAQAGQTQAYLKYLKQSRGDADPMGLNQ